jgi:hypothetical protein
MRTVNLPEITREQAQNEPAADRLQFKERAYPQNRATITTVYDGFTVQFELYDTGVGKVEQFIGTLQERGYTPAAVPTQSSVLKAQHSPGNGYKMPTDFTADGTPLCDNRNCSHVGQAMAPSKFGGWYCSGLDPKTGNAKGRCKEIA